MRNLLNLTVMQLRELFREKYPEIAEIADRASTPDQFIENLHNWFIDHYSHKIETLNNCEENTVHRLDLSAVQRIQTLFEIENRSFFDASLEESMRCETLALLWEVLKKRESEVKADFLLDFYIMLEQIESNDYHHAPELKQEEEWMRRWQSGLDPEISEARAENRERIENLLLEKIEKRGKIGVRYSFEPSMSEEEKLGLIKKWWGEYRFHLIMAIRDPEELNLFLANSLSEDTMELLRRAKRKGIPFFVTPYYLSLLSVGDKSYNDEAIRCYVIYSEELVDNFGKIKAWEKEDKVVKGEPNAAGWLLPNDQNIHRRYPEVAILIPDSMGRACGGLCAPCQRMYNFQSGHLNFDLEALKPTEKWGDKLERLIRYYENDSQLCDILITGGDSLMSRDKTLEEILDAVYRMANRKRKANRSRKPGTKYAEIKRVRLGTRLPAYLPCRITDNLINILSDFRERAEKIGISQFFIQTHFESPLEITQEVVDVVQKLLSAGWIVTNQLVFTVAASRRGHTARLREVLNKAGIITYYTFAVKGFNENYALFAPNGRLLQEQYEEKQQGKLIKPIERKLMKIIKNPRSLKNELSMLLRRWGRSFIATDRNVLNLPGIGKSMTFHTVGLTSTGRRILRFTLDTGRRHSPLVDESESVYIVENKSIGAYLRQLEQLGEDPQDYSSIWSCSEGVTEKRFKLFEYPEKHLGKTTLYTNITA